MFAIKKNGNKVLSRIEGFLEPKSSKDENFGDLKLYEKLEFEKLFANWLLKKLLPKSEIRKLKSDKWLNVAYQRWPCKMETRRNGPKVSLGL